jgi:hypothetical protein
MNQSERALVSVLVAIKNDHNMILLRNTKQVRWKVENKNDKMKIFVLIIY